MDAHFHNGAVTLPVSFLPIKAANTLVMHNSEQISFQLPYLKDLKSLMLSWHSFPECGSDRVTLSYALKCCQYDAYA